MRIERHASPVAGVQHLRDRVFLDVIDDNLGAIELGKTCEGFKDQAGALKLILEVRGMDEDRQVAVHCELDVFLKDGEFIAGIFVEADLTDTKHRRAIQKLRDKCHHLACKHRIVSLLRVDAQPTIMLDAVLRRTLRFVVGQLPEVIKKSRRRGAVEARPKGWLTQDFATSNGKFLLVVGGPADPVGVGFDVHVRSQLK